MFSGETKRRIAIAVQRILKETGNHELPDCEIKFLLHVDGAEKWSWCNIRNNSNALPGIIGEFDQNIIKEFDRNMQFTKDGD